MISPKIHLNKLLTPRSKALIESGHLTKGDEEYSLWMLTQDAFGWQNWMRKNGLEIEGNPESLIIAAGGKINWSEEDIVTYISGQGSKDTAVPACVFRGNEEADSGGEIVAWAHLFGLDQKFSKFCPQDLNRAVTEHIAKHRKANPKEKAVESQKVKDREEIDSNTELVSEQPQTKVLIGQEKAIQNDDGHAPDIARNRTLAQMGREISKYGEIKNTGDRVTEGRFGYKISINISDNTMRIYSKRHGEEPILVDADGEIDHQNSHVSTADVKHFKNVIQALKAVERENANEKHEQMTM